MKMVDIVSQTMPSETDVNVARNFLTKILRSSMRKNRFKGRDEPATRPHSWHSAKLTDDHPEPPPDQSQDTGAPVWQAKHEARSSPKEMSSSVGEPTSQQQVPTQFNSVSSMERVERPSQPFPPGRLSPSPDPHCATSTPSRRDSSLSCYSATSSPSDPAGLPGSSSPSADVLFYKGLQGEGARQGERPRYLQLPVGNGGWESPRSEEQPGSRFSSSGRSSYTGPVWHVPDRKKAIAPSPPPPPPPLRSDSFAATKVFPYSEGPSVHGQPKALGRNMDRLSEDHRGHHVPHHEKGPEVRRSYNPPPKKDFLHPNAAAEDYNHNQLNPNKLFSLSSTDVRQSQPPYAYLSNHQRQYSDESTFYLQTTRAAPPAKPQSVGSYYRSLQDLPTNACGRGSQSRSSTASLSSNAVDQNPDGGGQIRYYCITTKQPVPQVEPPVWPGKGEGGGGWWGDAETTQWSGHSDRSSVSCQKAGKVKYPPSQLAYADSKERNGHFRPANGHLASALSSSSKVTSEEGLRRAEGHSSEPPGRRVSHCQPSEPKVSPLREVQPDPWLALDDQRICPKKTPLLHSLTQESRSLAERPPAADGGDAPVDPSSGKLARRSDRYATTLRNEIQQKRAQLQKSRSAATLTCTSDLEEEETEGWRSSVETTASPSDGSYSTTYKDHLKEAQARVLQATSFRRRDLEPHGAEPHAGRPHRIGGRKRFALDKRMHSFSEPDQINKVGVEGESRTGNAGSFVDRRKFFEMTATKPAFSRPVSKSGQQSGPSGAVGGEHGEGRARGRAPSGDSQDSRRPSHPVDPSFRSHHHHQHHKPDPGPLSPGRRQAMLEQQRLGTFAEYQATWSLQRRPSDAKKTQGRYHSAENILDPDVEDKHVCQHERSRSSPSADFYGQNLPVSWREPAEQPYLECRQDLHSGQTARGPGESEGRDGLAQPDQFPQSPESSPGGDKPQSRDATAPLACHHKLPLDPADHTHALPPYPHNRSQSPGSEPPPQTKGPMPQRPHIGLETTSSSQEFLPGARADPALRPSPPGTQLDPAAPASDSSLGSTLAASPCPGGSSRPGSGRRVEGDAEEEAEGEEERGVTAEAVMLSRAASPPPPPCSSSSSKPAAAAATLAVPSASGARSPSPQRLSDEPPLSMQDEARSRTESVMETAGAAKKAPVKTVLAESSSEREGRQYLLHRDSPGGSGDIGPARLNHVGSPDHPHARPNPHAQSQYYAYTCQGLHSTTDTHPAREQTPPGAPEQDRGSLSADPPCSNGTSALVRGSEEDQKREELARDIMGKDKSLADILDQSKMKTTMDLMVGIFPQGEQLLEGTHQRRKVAPKHGSSKSTEERRVEEGVSAAVSLVPSSSYYSTSAPKAELLIKMKDMQERMEEQDSEDELDLNLAGKKELILSLSRKLEVLREARESFQEDVADNNALGEEVEATVQQLCKPNELDKFRMFVGDLDKVVSLLLSLSGRLARVENALNSLEEDALPEEKRTLTEKRKLLILQHEDAKELKENLDRRERLVSGIMESHLSAASLADYQHFVKMKSALIIEQRKLEDKIKLGEEQLKCLTDSLPLEQRLLF